MIEIKNIKKYQKNLNNSKCPVCKKRSSTKVFSPFCSKYCSDIDLSNWLDGRYYIQEDQIRNNH